MNLPNDPQSPDKQPNLGGNPDEEDLIPLVPSSVPRTPNLGGKKKIPPSREESPEISGTSSPTASPVPIPAPDAPESAAIDESSQPHRSPTEAWSGGRGKGFQSPELGILPLDESPLPASESAPGEPSAPGFPAGITEVASTPMESQVESGEPSSAEAENGRPATKKPSDTVDDALNSNPEGTGLMPKDKTWLTILLVGLLIVTGGLYYFLRDGLPTKNAYQATSKPSLPIKGEKIVVEDLELRWKDNGSQTASGNLNTTALYPEALLRFAPQSNGAVRLFFKNERDHQVGDTVNFEVRDGRAGEGNQNVVTCTEGLRSRIEYDHLRSRANSSWTLEIWEGTDQLGPISGFTLLARVYLPWNLGAPTPKP